MLVVRSCAKVRCWVWELCGAVGEGYMDAVVSCESDKKWVKGSTAYSVCPVLLVF
jgi:hypothetical protein